jgi:hypothetical protein
MAQLVRITQRRYEEWLEAHPGETGPNGVDWIAEALIGSPYLNDEIRRGQTLSINRFYPQGREH